MDLLGNISWVVCSKVIFIEAQRLFMEYFMDWSCFKVRRKIRKMLSMNLFQKKISEIKASQIVFL